MKKILLIAAVAAMIFPACTKEKNNAPEAGTLDVVLKIPNVQPATRAIGETGVTPAVTIPINGGHVFIINSAGNIIDNVALDVAQATNTGQVIESVPPTAKIFVLGNIPDDVDVTDPSFATNLTDLLNTTSDIFAQEDYKIPALGNVNGAPVSVTVLSETSGEANVTIRPLYSRIELAKVTGGTNADGDKVTEFTVTGVWVDAWHPLFTLAGLNGGTIYNQLISTDFDNNDMGDEGSWAAAGTAGAMTAVPEVGKVWYHHVPAGGLPRLIVRIEGLKYELADGTEVDLSADDPYFLTVKNYVVGGQPLTEFKAGHIYKIGNDAGITFKAPDNIHPNPNPGNIDITLTVEVQDWIIVTPDAELY